MDPQIQYFTGKYGNGLEMSSEDDLTVIAKKTDDAVNDPSLSKVALVDLNLQSPGKPWNSKGFYFEVKVETCFSGFIPSFALGFTTIDDPNAGDFNIPRRACDMNDTLMVGYTGKIYWNGGIKGRQQASVSWDPSKYILARGADNVGILLAPDASRVDFFHNNTHVITYSLTANRDEIEHEEVKKLVDPSKTLYGVVDVYGGPQRIRVYSDRIKPGEPEKPTEGEGDGGKGEEEE